MKKYCTCSALLKVLNIYSFIFCKYYRKYEKIKDILTEVSRKAETLFALGQKDFYTKKKKNIDVYCCK